MVRSHNLSPSHGSFMVGDHKQLEYAWDKYCCLKLINFSPIFISKIEYFSLQCKDLSLPFCFLVTPSLSHFLPRVYMTNTKNGEEALRWFFHGSFLCCGLFHPPNTP